MFEKEDDDDAIIDLLLVRYKKKIFFTVFYDFEVTPEMHNNTSQVQHTSYCVVLFKCVYEKGKMG